MWKERAHGNRLPCDKKLVWPGALDEWRPALIASPTPMRKRTLSPLEQDHLRRQTATWLADGVIEATRKSPWTCNPVFVEKKNGTIRTCIDYRPVNAVTQDFDWPLPRLQDLRHRTRGARWFTRMDLRDAFFRIKVPTEWRPLTCFTCDGKDYQFRKMPFGLKTAPSVFQRFMDYGLRACKNFSFWYIDDVLVYATHLTELRALTERVRRALRAMKVEVNEAKSEYEKQGLLFAGMWVYAGGQGPNLAKVKEVLALPVPRTKVERESALGLVSWLRDHIPLASLLTASLMPRQGEEVSKEELEIGWKRLTSHIARSITTLGHWNEEKEAQLFTDASQTGVAAVLVQEGRIIALASRKLTPAETRYSTTDREHLSLLLAAEKLKIFLHRSGAETYVFNDHAAHVSRRTTDMTPRQTRWYLNIARWIPTIRHVKGKNNPADFFSRWPVEILGGQIRI